MNKKNHFISKEACYICKKRLTTDNSNKNIIKSEIIIPTLEKYREAAHDICNLRYKTLKVIPVVFHNGSTYDYKFIIKTLTIEVEGQFECFKEDTENYTSFSVLIIKRILYKIKFIHSFRFMSSSLSGLVDNLSE